ncbi:adenylate isopentenyltransferase 5, chloroplastic-like [Salvia hispanica]|uniref:adenylate isopentenyltransferase 5, chloroplastic-like n=1 Tax=Salvia hispanica TaxID=49212 RepID=UPI00200960C0|nr:adenylate isopentenyltransferase 5, chloroplastic-like [Salvia hispanica]
MNISLSAACKQTQPPMVNFPGNLLNLIPRPRRKDKVVVVMGATGTGKSRLSIELAIRFDAEVINSDKIQVFKGLDIVTNKVTEEECDLVPHHLLGFVEPTADYWAHDFVHHATAAAADITERGRTPIIAGGSNSFIKALICDDHHFRSRYDCCLLWVDVAKPLLNSFLSARVDQMVDSGLVEEAREFFDPAGDYSRGIRRAIGLPELDEYFRSEGRASPAERAKLLSRGVDQIKFNNQILASRQRQNIRRLLNILRQAEHLDCRMHKLDATEVFRKRGEEAEEAWQRLVAEPSTSLVGQFLYEDQMGFAGPLMLGPTTTAPVVV